MEIAAVASFPKAPTIAVSAKLTRVVKICSTKTVGELEVASRVTVQLLNTDPDVRPRERIVKKSEKQGLYQAMDIASIWLDRALSQ